MFALCTHYQLGKCHKLPFTDSFTNYTTPLELVSTDLWGPSLVDTYYSFKYYLSFVDAYSRFTWIYFLVTKSETHNAVI